MAVCLTCNREMLSAPSCRTRFGAVRYGTETGLPDDHDDRCGDCGVALGGVHHQYCDQEECGVCHEQLIACEHGQ